MTAHEAVFTIDELLLHLRERLINALKDSEEKALGEIEIALNAIEDAIIARQPRHAAHLLVPIDHMISAIGDYFHGVTWKSTIPTVEEIQEAFSNQ